MNQPTTQSISTPTTPNVEVTATAMPQAPIPPPTFQSPSYESGGDTGSDKSNPFKDFFSDINLVEAAILGLGVATFLYAIYYYKFEMTMTKTGYADLNARLNKIELMTSKIASEKNANGKNSNRSNPRRRMLI
ncbi:MAG: hypothetical protein ACOVNU_09210 [Candidatus Kapaibacteriota bacterium]